MDGPPGSSSGDGASSSGSGADATPTTLAATLRHMLTVDDEDFDCTIVLVLPGEKASDEDSKKAEDRPAKRAKQGSQAVAHATVTCRASSVALKQHSEVFRCWMKGWITKNKRQRPNHTLQIECDDREEVEAFQRLLDYVHSAGHMLPDDASSIFALLSVARKHAAEACADACVQLLLGKVDQLPLKPCLRLLSLLETGVSGKDDVQAAADRLFVCSTKRLTVLLGSEAARMAADAELQAALASFLGSWHGMLNCALRREVWLALPFELLLAMFEDRHVHADTEATVLAAFVLWTSANIAGGQLADDTQESISAICSRIRFPQMPPDVLINYWACFSWFQQYDKSRDLLLRAVVTGADQVQQALWRRQVEEAGDLPPCVAALASISKCRLWWKERELPLVPDDTDTATFDLQISHPGDSDEVASAPVYWRGYYWQCKLGVSPEGATTVGVTANCSPAAPLFANYEHGPFVYQMQAIYRVRLLSSGQAEASLDTLQGVGLFSPASFFHNRGASHVLDTIPWQQFWAEDSPFRRGRAADVELTLGVPPSC